MILFVPLTRVMRRRKSIAPARTMRSPCAARRRTCSWFVTLLGGVRTTPSSPETRLCPAQGLSRRSARPAGALSYASVDEERTAETCCNVVMHVYDVGLTMARSGRHTTTPGANDHNSDTAGPACLHGAADDRCRARLCKFADPRSEDFDELWRRVETYLQRRALTRCATERHPEADAVLPRRFRCKVHRRAASAEPATRR